MRGYAHTYTSPWFRGWWSGRCSGSGRFRLSRLPKLAAGGLVLGGALVSALSLVSYSPGSRLLDWEGNPEEADMSVPPLTCMKGRLRCTANRDATEECDGKTWQHKIDCNTKAGDTCVEGTCRTQCELAPRGNVGCSFFPGQPVVDLDGG